MEHLQPLLGHPRDLKSFIRASEQLSRARVPRSIQEPVWLWRLTAFQKPNGGVGIVAGGHREDNGAHCVTTVDVRSPARHSTVPVRVGDEEWMRAHALQGLTELNPRIIVTSIDRISAYDLISRQAMLDRVKHIARGSALPFASNFFGSIPQVQLARCNLAG